jgi:hypothetical protein
MSADRAVPAANMTKVMLRIKYFIFDLLWGINSD